MFKDNLMMLRKTRGMTQEELAEKIDVSRQTLSKYETGESLPDVEKSRLIAEVFDVTLDELVTGAEPQLKVETPPVMVSASMPGRKIAGIILFCMAFLAFLIPTGLGGSSSA